MGETMTVDEAIRARRSVRGFLAREAPEALIREAFELAQWAPSNCNVQPWSAHVVSGAVLADLKRELVAAAEAGTPITPDYSAEYAFTGVYRERQIDAARQLYAAMGVARGDQEGRKRAFLRNFVAFDAPHVAFVFMNEAFGVREAADVGMYGQTLILALAARGLATCPQGALSLYPDIVRRRLGVGTHEKLLFGIGFGYEDGEVPANAARVGRAAEAAKFHR
jgi:nitroreductase